MLYAVLTKEYDIIKALVDAGADVNVKNFKLVTPLMFSAGVNDIETMKLLIENGADIEHKNKDGERALEFAIRKEQKEAADYLKTVSK
ncbi:ankyrin repeat domain-containing protein [Brachyspira hyodysenteriae]|nr:ankyrin repeat domain-containing protein [Brachyspira hyodysenteriae]MDA0030163.1 ankyrin repeat domain-containing protein [Brachyspira hyodysenteriae]